MSRRNTPEEAVLEEYPPQHIRIVGSRESGDLAVVLIDARPTGPPYLYVEHLRRLGGDWGCSSSSNAEGGWVSTSEDGEIGYAFRVGEAPDNVDMVRVACGDAVREEPVAHGAWLSVWWNEPHESWPSIVEYRIRGAWISASDRFDQLLAKIRAEGIGGGL